MHVRRCGFLVFDGLQAIDLFGPLEALQEANALSGAPRYSTHLVSHDGEPITTYSGVRISADCSIEDAPPFNTLFIPGGEGARAPNFPQEVTDWLQRIAPQTPRVGSVCTGLFVLASSGLLDGRTATTHWRHSAEASERFPSITVHGHELFQRDGKFFTAAGVTAGIDLTLALIEEDFGTRLAGEVARQLVVHLRRSGDQRQYSSFLAAQVASDDTLDGLVEWIADNLDQDLSAFVLAERVNLGERQFRRRFTSLFGETPVRYVTRVRLEAARHLLLTTRQDIAVIAESVGYAHADSFRRAFERHFSIAPSEYRQRFAPARRTSRRAIIAGAAAVLGGACVAGRQRRERAGDYVCRPCGCADDGKAFAEPGACPSCGMLLEPAAPLFEPDRLPIGASAFFTRGYRGTTIRVHTFVPEGLRPNSRVLIVLPGAGRNGAQYRDHWATLAASASIVIAALTYPERDYDFAAYHMGGVIQDLNFQHVTELPPNQIRLREEDISFSINRDPSRWMFVDFDRVHRLVARATAAENPRYDLFGHSAGAQILHRAALLGSMGRADRIIAANAGFYTMPSDHHPLPFGLNGLAVDDARLRRAFGRSLILLLGEADNESETRGTFLRTPTADAQGLGRFARGEQFYRAAEAEARRLDIPLTWRKVPVAGVGHDFRQMSDAAAELLR